MLRPRRGARRAFDASKCRRFSLARRRAWIYPARCRCHEAARRKATFAARVMRDFLAHRRGKSGASGAETSTFGRNHGNVRLSVLPGEFSRRNPTYPLIHSRNPRRQSSPESGARYEGAHYRVCPALVCRRLDRPADHAGAGADRADHAKEEGGEEEESYQEGRFRQEEHQQGQDEEAEPSLIGTALAKRPSRKSPGGLFDSRCRRITFSARSPKPKRSTDRCDGQRSAAQAARIACARASRSMRCPRSAGHPFARIPDAIMV